MEVTKKCEKCGQPVTATQYKIDYILAEEYYTCPVCGFVREWAYGKLGPNDSEYSEEEYEEDGGFDPTNPFG